MKYIFVTGGVVSGLGKGIAAASLGRLMKSRGLKVTMQKIDPYLNIDPGTMNPLQHGEVFVTEDGAETDLDLGHYERFIDENLSQNSSISSGRVYSTVLKKERKGDYKGNTVQVIPHITDEIKARIRQGKSGYELAIIEIGGTIGDIEGLPIIEATRQFASEVGRENCLFIHVTLIPYIAASQEQKTKPTQHSVKDLLSLGIQPDIIICRSDIDLEPGIKEKIALFCNVKKERVIENLDLKSLYDVPLALRAEGLDDLVCKLMNYDLPDPDLSEWIRMCEIIKNPQREVTIALVGKYASLKDSYISVVEALLHGGIACDAKVEIKWLDASLVKEEDQVELFADVDGIIVPGGFGERGIEGKIIAASYARQNNIPYFGICLGMQVALIEFARKVMQKEDANSSEFDPATSYPIVDLMNDQEDVEQIGGTMRLGRYSCKVDVNSKAYSLYQQSTVSERHRHRYELNNNYRDELKSFGMVLSGTSPDNHIVEMIELANHPWYLACQFHPEFKSRPNRPHPLFKGFIEAALKKGGTSC